MAEGFGQIRCARFEKLFSRNAVRREPGAQAQQVIGRGGFVLRFVERKAERGGDGFLVVVTFDRPFQLLAPDAPVLREGHPVSGAHVGGGVFEREDQAAEVGSKGFGFGVVGLARAFEKEGRGFFDAPLGDAHWSGQIVPLLIAGSDQHMAVSAQPLDIRTQCFGQIGVVEDKQPGLAGGEGVDHERGERLLVRFVFDSQQGREGGETGEERGRGFGFVPRAEFVAGVALLGEAAG